MNRLKITSLRTREKEYLYGRTKLMWLQIRNSFLRSRYLFSPYRDYFKDTKLLILFLQKTVVRLWRVNTVVF